MSDRLQPPLLGGLFIGVLSALPFVSSLNACCCIWVISGGVLTSYLLQERSPVAITAGGAAVAGLLAGALGAILSSVLAEAIALMRGITPSDVIDQLVQRGDVPAEISRGLEPLRDLPRAAWFFASLIMTLIVYPIFAMLGGLLGVAMFKKNPPPPPPGTMEVLPPEMWR